MKSVLKGAKAGDSIVLRNGTWHDAKLKFERLSGTAEAPILIRAATAGRVVFTGTTEFRVSGKHLAVSGFVFRDTDGVSDVLQLRTHSQRLAHHCRVTDCVFEQTADSDKGIESRWLSVYGTNNRVDHCYFAGKRSRGATLVIWVSDANEAHRIDHNHFGPRPDLGRNGGETIRIGTSQVSESNCRSVVESNYFHACDGEVEVISNKSCENIYRHNVFEKCDGTLTLRHGHRCLVDSNVFLGGKKNGTGGIRLIGENHTVINNYLEGLRGDAERAAICLMNGIPDGPLNGFAPVRNATIAHNTLIDCKVSMEIGVGAGEKQSAAPKDIRIANNLILPGKWHLFRAHSQLDGFVWSGNKLQPGGRTDENKLVEIDRVEPEMKQGKDGLLHASVLDPLQVAAEPEVKKDIDGHARDERTFAGCDDPRTPRRNWASPENTGPTWMRAAQQAKAQKTKAQKTKAKD